MSALVFDGVSAAGHDGRPILSAVSWEVEEASVGVVIGPSGSGKSTLLRLPNRLMDPDAGTVRVLGHAADQWAICELRRAVGWVPQRPVLSAGTVRDNLELPRRLGVVSADENDGRVREAIRVAGLGAELLERPVALLSGGERSRVGIARALVARPRLLIMDEPTASLDGQSAARMWDAVLTWCRDRGATLVAATHRLADVQRLQGRILVVVDGEGVLEGDTGVLLASPRGDRVRHILSGDRLDLVEGP